MYLLWVESAPAAYSDRGRTGTLGMGQPAAMIEPDRGTGEVENESTELASGSVAPEGPSPPTGEAGHPEDTAFERSPAVRGASTDAELAEATPSEYSIPSAPPTTVAPARRRHRAARYTAGALALSAMVFGALRWGPGRADAPPAEAASIAVLPLANLSTDPRDAALADGMTEELIARLAKTGGLRVIASTSVFSFRDRKLDVRSIADSLHVRHLLEGGFQKSGSRLRVLVRLVDASDGSTRWSETYDRELSDVFAVQDEIARAVSRELGLRLGGAVDAGRPRQQNQNIAAYELYLRGNDPALLRSDRGVRQAIEYFQQAIELDSTYAAAYAGLARMYLRLGAVNEPGLSPRDRSDLAERSALKALALDDSVAEAHASLGLVRLNGYELAAAETHLKRAVELDPTRAQFHEWLTRVYGHAGRPADALGEARRALELDPLSPSAHAAVARALVANDRCDEALVQLEKVAAVQPPLLQAKVIVSHCYIRRGMWPEAIATLRAQLDRGGSTLLAILGYALARAGHRGEAVRVQATLLERRREANGGASELALMAAGLGDLDQSFGWLGQAIDEGSLNQNVAELLFDHVRGDPRFVRLRDRSLRQNR